MADCTCYGCIRRRRSKQRAKVIAIRDGYPHTRQKVADDEPIDNIHMEDLLADMDWLCARLLQHLEDQ